MLHWVFRPPERAPSGGEWLSEAERATASRLTIERRRHDWLRGRRAAKQAVAAVLRERWGEPPPLASLEVDTEKGGAPFVRLAAAARPALGFAPGQRLPLEVSISHRAGAVFCVAAATGEVGEALGADLELVEPRSPGFVGDFLSSEEIAACGRGPLRDLLVTTIWSAKEAVLKALHLGLTVDTRAVVCLPEHRPAHDTALGSEAAGWSPFRLSLAAAAGRGEVSLLGRWRTRGAFVQTLVYAPGAVAARGTA
jgi:4'-phosphopantetheinyl transferase